MHIQTHMRMPMPTNHAQVDERVLKGGHYGRGIAANFEHAGLPPPERLLLGDAADIDTLLPPADADGRYRAFDAIVTDPPYGLMEGLGDLFVPLSERVRLLVGPAAPPTLFTAQSSSHPALSIPSIRTPPLRALASRTPVHILPLAGLV